MEDMVDLSFLIQDTENFVKDAIALHDGSHDFWHIHRVRTVAKAIALQEGLSPDRIQIVELSALLHDVDDWKYSGSETCQDHAVQAFLRSKCTPEAVVSEVCNIIRSIGFKESLQSREEGNTNPKLSKEGMIVQDADRLDAVGAVGIARCFTFGGAFNRVLHDPSIPPRVGMTKLQYMSSAKTSHNTTINHFHEKLLLLKDLMKTDTGRKMAVTVRLADGCSKAFTEYTYK